MKVDVKITDRTKELKQEMEKKILQALTAVGLQAEGDAKIELENSPRRVDTGLLRNSITYAISGESPHITSYTADKAGEGEEKKSGKYSGSIGSKKDHAVYIGTNVEYAVYVHEGTTRMAPNRFLKNAIEKHWDNYQNIIKSYLSKE